MAALMWRACGVQKRWDRLLGCGVSLSGIPVRSFHANQRKLHTASTAVAVKIRPLYVLLGTGGGYAGYKQYEGYKDRRLEKLGVEVPPKVAYTWEVGADIHAFCCNTILIMTFSDRKNSHNSKCIG